MTGQVFVGGGFGPVGDRYPSMSPSLRASLAASDAAFVREAERAERQRREAWQESHERAVDAEMWRIAREEGLPLGEARRRVGHEKHEFAQLAVAKMDLEDAQRNARRQQALRQAGIDPDSGDELDVPQPPAREVETAARMMRTGDDPVSVGRAVRRKWLRREHQGDLR